MKQLPEDHIHLWHVDLNLPVDPTFLSSNELERYQALTSIKRQQEYGVCRIALRTILARYLEISPHDIVYTYNDCGKPYVTGIQFNLSHTSNTAVIAVAHESIGVDIESQCRTVTNIEGITQRFFHPDEAQWVLENEAESSSRFLQCWTAKEAIVKAIGSGISEQLDSFSVAQQSQVTVPNEGCWQLYPFIQDDLYGCAAYQQADCHIQHYEFGH